MNKIEERTAQELMSEGQQEYLEKLLKIEYYRETSRYDTLKKLKEKILSSQWTKDEARELISLLKMGSLVDLEIWASGRKKKRTELLEIIREKILTIMINIEGQ